MIGSMNDNIIHTDDLALEVLKFMKKNYPNRLVERYEVDPQLEGVPMMEAICEYRHCYKKGKEPDLQKIAGIIIDDFRSGRFGRISLELPELPKTPELPEIPEVPEVPEGGSES